MLRAAAEDAYPSFLARVACAVDACGATLATWIAEKSTGGPLRLRFLKNSLFAAKVIMVLMATALRHRAARSSNMAGS